MSYRPGDEQEREDEKYQKDDEGWERHDGEDVANRRSKVTSERVALLVICCLLAAAAIVIYRLSFVHFQNKKILQTMKGENEAMRKNLTVSPLVDKPSPTCERGWQQHGGMCYFFSNKYRSWNRSRHFCQSQGGDLVKINSREEQSFLKDLLRHEMNFDDDKFWIGLTDSQEEGRWLWVDGSELDTSLAFWIRGEPDDWKEKGSEGEDCASMGERSGTVDLKCWFDRPCFMDQSIICEKPV